MINIGGDGHVLKARSVANLELSTEYPTADDGFIAASIQNTYKDYLWVIVKVDAKGNLAWSRTYKPGQGVNIHTVGTYVNSNNEIFVTGYAAIGNAFNPFNTFICKTGKSGEMPSGFCIHNKITISGIFQVPLMVRVFLQ